ncbi:SpoIID/LytB domain-containing protein [Clostridia bacterium OttesenSCG-928-O13]|nr:SpoIID/LytB domain-containing protein [Clostridia bacterium OttesenSCG-928-O13]
MGKHVKLMIFAAVLLAVFVGVLGFLTLGGKDDAQQPVVVGLQNVNGESFYYNADGVQQYGWQTIDGHLYYFDLQTGAAVRGWFTDADGMTYYFGAEGWALTGEQVIDGKTYHFDSNGRLIEDVADEGYSWQQENGKHYYKDGDGVPLTGLQTIGGSSYYFDKDGVRQSGLHTIDGKTYYFSPESGRAAKGWTTVDGKTYYFGADGAAVVGTQSIDGKKYEFDEKGVLKQGTQTSGGKKTESSSSQPEVPVVTPEPAKPDPAQPAAQGKWITKDGKLYFQKPDGTYQVGIVDDDTGRYFCNVQTGERETGLISYDNETYYFDEQSGKAITGWKSDPANPANNYYFDSLGKALKSIQVLPDGNRYLFDATTGVQRSGLAMVDNKLYYFAGENSCAVTGWHTVSEEPQVVQTVRSVRMMANSVPQSKEKTYYFCDDFFALTGLQNIPDEKGVVGWFGFDELGVQLYGWQEISGSRYYFDPESGKAHTEKWTTHPDDYDAVCRLGANGAMCTDLTTVEGELYCFDSDGKRLSGWVSVGEAQYCFNGTDNRAIKNDWQNNEAGERFYLGSEGAALVGVQELGGDTYFFSPAGVMQVGRQDTDKGLYFFTDEGKAEKKVWKTDESGIYYLGDKGAAVSGLHTLTTEAGATGIFHFSPSTFTRDTEWVTTGGKKYYFSPETGMATIGSYSEGINHYFFGTDGAAVSGVHAAEDGLNYYFDTNTFLRKTGWQKWNGGNYYFDPETASAVKGWFPDAAAKAIFYFDDTGRSVTGPKNIDNRDYQFDENGRLMSDGTNADGNWVENNGNTYFVDATGSFVTELQEIDKALYFFGPDGAMRTGWVTYLNKQYYFTPADETIEDQKDIGQAVTGWFPSETDKQYYLGADGAAYTGVKNVGNDLYCFDATGKIRTGPVSENGKTYYFDPATGGKAHSGWSPSAGTAGAKYYYKDTFAMATGKTLIDGKWYLFGDTGERVRDWYRDENNLLYAFFGEGDDHAITGSFYDAGDGQKYYLTQDGYALVGLKQISENSDLYYFDQSGVQQFKFQTVEGQLYYFDPATGEAWTGKHPIDGATYYFDDADAYAHTGVYLNGGWTYVFGADGKLISERATESHAWKTGEDGQLYYTDSTGAPFAVGVVRLDDGYIYMFTDKGAALTGWQTDGTYKYYFGKDGRAHIGWFTDTDGKSYYFNSEGQALTSDQTELGDDYGFNDEGELIAGTVPIVNEWVEVPGGWTYHNNEGEVAVGITEIGGKYYYFDSEGLQQTGWKIDGGSRYYLDPSSGTGNGKGTALTGWNKVEGAWYLFGGDGKQAVKWQVREDNEGNVYTYYYYDDIADEETYGTLPVDFVTVGGLRRYFYAEGHMAIDWQDIEQSRYYFFSNGELATGVVTIEGKLYSFGADGKAATGFNRANDGKRYYFTDGSPVKGWREIDDRWYYFDETDFHQKTGWQNRPVGDTTWRYYYNDDGTLPEAGERLVNGVMRTIHPDGHMALGWEKIDGKVYYFDYQGKKATGHTTIGSIFYPFAEDGSLEMGWADAPDGNRYYYTDAGAATGWYYLPNVEDGLEGVWYRFNDETGVQLTGWQTRTKVETPNTHNYKHYFYPSGEEKGTAAIGWTTFGGVRRFFSDEGSMAEGWKTLVPWNGGEESLYYFLPDSGEMATGLHTIDGAQYAFDADGKIQRGWNWNAQGQRYYVTEEGALLGWQLIDGRWYYLDEVTGHQHMGWQMRNDTDGKAAFHFYFDDGTQAAAGWTTTIDGVNRHVTENGAMTKGFVTIGGARYLFDLKGEAQTGWQQHDGKWYVFDSTGKQLTGWQERKQANGYVSQYYYHANGTIAASGWNQEIENTRRFVMDDGEMAKGWLATGGYKYYFGDKGVPLTGLHTINGAACAFDSQGRYVTPPVIDKIEYQTGTAAEKVVTIHATVNSLLTDRTIMYSFDGGANWTTINNKKFAAGTNIAAGTLQIRDSLGNVTKYNTAIQIESARTTLHGVDVSKYQGSINWAQVAASGKVDFAVIRGLGWDSTKGYYAIDPYFNYNVRQAKAHGIKVGAYLYSYAFSKSEMLEEVSYFMNSSEVQGLLRDGILFDLPVYVDYEDPLITKNTGHLSKAERTDIVRYGMVLIEQMSQYRYTGGFYVNMNWAENVIEGRTLQYEGYPLWLARWGPVAHGWSPAPQMWQYNNGTYTRGEYYHGTTVPGIPGRVDMNWWYNAPTASGGTSVAPPAPNPSPSAGGDYPISVTSGGQVVTGNASEIIAQVVMAEVGGFGNAEVFKAQAVAAQSWIREQQTRGYTAPTVALKAPTQAVRDAVNQVLGEVVTYNGQVAMTPYFAYGNGMTNDAKYWNKNNNYPYLVPVRSDYDPTVKPAYTGTITEAELKARLEATYYVGITNGYAPQDWIQVTGRNAGGYITSLNVCGRTPGVEYFYLNILPYSSGGRKVYPVGSPDFTVSYSGGVFTFTTRGYGHCIGMSQYGAYGLALQGYNYRQILSHFYPGTSIGKI